METTGSVAPPRHHELPHCNSLRRGSFGDRRPPYQSTSVPYLWQVWHPPSFYGDTYEAILLISGSLWPPSQILAAHTEFEVGFILSTTEAGGSPDQVPVSAHVLIGQNVLQPPRILFPTEPKRHSQQHIRLTPAAGGVEPNQSAYAVSLRVLLTLSGLVLGIAAQTSPPTTGPPDRPTSRRLQPAGPGGAASSADPAISTRKYSTGAGWAGRPNST